MLVVVVVVKAVVLRPVAAARVERAFSTMLLRMLVATAAVLPGVMAGRAIPDLPGVATVRSRGSTRELEVVGEST
jgi:hypothetical protein